MEKENNVIEIGLIDFWKVLKRCWWVLLAVAILFSGVAYLIMYRAHVDQYASTAVIYVNRTDGRTQISDASLATAIMDDCKRLALSEDHVIRPAIENLSDYSFTEEELREKTKWIKNRVSVRTTGADEHLLEVKVTSGTPDGAAQLANAVAQSATDYFNQLFGKNMAHIEDSAKTPTSISNPISLTKAAFVGLAAAVMVYLAWLIVYLFDDRIDSESKVEKRLGLTILGSIPYQGGSARRKNRYGSEYGYYGYGPGLEQQKAQAALSSKNDKKEDKKA